MSSDLGCAKSISLALSSPCPGLVSTLPGSDTLLCFHRLSFIVSLSSNKIMLGPFHHMVAAVSNDLSLFLFISWVLWKTEVWESTQVWFPPIEAPPTSLLLKKTDILRVWFSLKFSATWSQKKTESTSWFCFYTMFPMSCTPHSPLLLELKQRKWAEAKMWRRNAGLTNKATGD